MNIDYTYTVELTNWFFITFFIGTLLSTMINNFLDWLNYDKGDVNTSTKILHSLHPMLKKMFSLNKIKKSIEYNRINDKFSMFYETTTSCFSSIVMMFGIIPFLLATVMSWTNGNLLLSYMILMISMTLFKTVSSLPFSYYDTFVIENRFGFNNTSMRLFVTDTLKGMVMSTVFSLVMISILNYVLTSFGRYSAVNICMLVGGFLVLQYIMEFFYMTIGIRMFNRLTPLKDKKLLSRINNLFRKCGYSKAPKVMVMDASKRNSHGNAFVGGIGASKKIVLFDTLLKNHTPDEILAILGHEIGHNSNHDMIKNRILNAVDLLVTTFIVFTFIYNPSLYHAFGFSWVNDENVVKYSFIGFNLAMMMVGAFRWMLEPLYSYISRRMEYRADAFSAKHVSSAAMISSLIKLSSDNLADTFPHPIYEMWNYDHPSLVNRILAVMPKKMLTKSLKVNKDKVSTKTKDVKKQKKHMKKQTNDKKKEEK